MKPLVIALLLVLAAAPAGPPAGAPAGPAPTAPPAPEEQLEEFIPSEKLPADSAISVPVDI